VAGSRLAGWAVWVGAAAIVTGAALAGCGTSSPVAQSSAGHSRVTQSGPAAAAAGQRVMITGTDMLRFRPMVVRARVGTVRITLTDLGAYPHDIVIPALGVTSATVTGDPGSGSVSFTVRFHRPGRYRFHCQYHASSGMTGVFVIS
jgi:plastocyanin